MEDYYECLHHRKEVRCRIARPRGPPEPLADPDLLCRLPESGCSRPPTGRPRPRSCRRTPRPPAKYGISGCWARRRTPRRCWGRARPGPATTRPFFFVYIRLRSTGARRRSESRITELTDPQLGKQAFESIQLPWGLSEGTPEMAVDSALCADPSSIHWMASFCSREAAADCQVHT